MADGEIPNTQPFGEFGGIQGIMQILQGLFGGGSSSNSDSSSPEGLQSAMALLGPLLGEFGQNDYSAAAADRDSQGAVDNIIRQMSEAGNPIIQGAENASGGYNSTTAGLLRNDLAARITSAGAAEKTNTKTKYAAARQAQISQILSLIKIIADAHKTQAITNQTQGLAQNTAARNAAAAAAALAAARQALKGGGSAGKPDKGGGASSRGSGSGTDAAGDVGIGAGTTADGEIDFKDATKQEENMDDILDRYPDDSFSGQQTEEDARSEDPFYEPSLTADNSDPFALLGEIGNPDTTNIADTPDLGLDNLGDLGDLTGGGDTGDGGGADFDFGGDIPDDYWFDDFNDPGDGYGGP